MENEQSIFSQPNQPTYFEIWLIQKMIQNLKDHLKDLTDEKRILMHYQMMEPDSQQENRLKYIHFHQTVIDQRIDWYQNMLNRYSSEQT